MSRRAVSLGERAGAVRDGSLDGLCPRPENPCQVPGRPPAAAAGSRRGWAGADEAVRSEGRPRCPPRLPADLPSPYRPPAGLQRRLGPVRRTGPRAARPAAARPAAAPPRGPSAPPPPYWADCPCPRNSPCGQVAYPSARCAAGSTLRRPPPRPTAALPRRSPPQSAVPAPRRTGHPHPARAEAVAVPRPSQNVPEECPCPASRPPRSTPPQDSN